jgi:hypothetical protein
MAVSDSGLAAWIGTTVAVLLDDEGSDQWLGGDAFLENQSGGKSLRNSSNTTTSEMGPLT